METCVLERSVTERAKRHGARIKKLREDRDLSKGLLMDRLGFKTSRAYDLYEEGTSIIRLDRLEDWADAFNLTAEQFVAIVVLDAPDPVVRSRVEQSVEPLSVSSVTVDYAARLIQQLTPEAQDDLLKQIADIADGAPEQDC